jgi:hypothetical protein
MPTAQPTASEPAHRVYIARQTALQSEYDSASTLARRLKLALFTAIAFALAAIYLALHNNASSWPILATFLLAAFLLNRLLRTHTLRNRLLRLLHHYEIARGRIEGTKRQSGHTGEEFRTPSHLYDRDLDILGRNSLFGLLATVRTGVGRLGLANYLLNLPTGDTAPSEILERRHAIQELAPRNDLREAIALLGASRFQEVAANLLDHWLEDPPPAFPRAIRPSLYITTTLSLILALLGLTGAVRWAPLRPNLLALLATQSVIALSIRRRVVDLLDSASRLSNQMEMFRDGLTLLQSEPFTSTRLQSLQQASRSPRNAIPVIAGIQRQFIVVEQRTKEWFLLPALLLCAGTHAALSIAAWKRNHAQSMQRWLATWAEFEALNSLATYAYEHPADIYPEILSTRTAHFEATALAHPLLPASAVANDIALNSFGSDRPDSLYLISGSNMAGKSTLLRAIGLNAVLAATGAPIRASAARISPLTLGASIALTDSLAEGKSKFLAEVERLRAILRAAEDPASLRTLFLIDEIFSGTNSLDRRAAAESIAHSLIAHGAIGALSTHDLTLTEMAANPALRAINVHMASSDPTDPLAFDYLLKPGINQTSNALAILRMMGLETALASLSPRLRDLSR